MSLKNKILHTIEVILEVGLFLLALGWVLKTTLENPPLWLKTFLNFIPEDGYEPILVLGAMVVGIFASRGVRSVQKPNDLTVLANLSENKDTLNNAFGISNLISHGSINPKFTGREEILKQIDESFRVAGQSYQILQGVDGIGKTQIALEYAYEKSDEYTNGTWVLSASSISIFEASLSQLAEAVVEKYASNTSIEEESDEKFDYLFEWLRNTSDWLLIIDDANDLEIFQRFLVGIKGKIIVTSTNPRIKEIFNPSDIVNIPVLEEEDAIKLFNSITNAKVSKSRVKKIVKALGYIPLLIEGVSRIFSEMNHTVDFESIDVNNAEELEKFIDIATSFFLQPIWEEIFSYYNKTSWFRVTKKLSASSAAGVLLNTLLLCHHRNIPSYLLDSVMKNSSFYFDMSNSKIIQRIIFKIFNNNRYYHKCNKVKNDIINVLIRKSIITTKSPQKNGYYIGINDTIQNVLLSRWLPIVKNNKLSMLGLNGSVRFINDLFITSNEEKKVELLPHVISCIENLRKYDLKLKGMIYLCDSISAYFQSIHLFQSASKFSQYSYDLEKAILGKPSIAGYIENINNRLQGFMNIPLDLLDEEISSKGGEVNLIAKNFVKGHKKFILGKWEEAIEALEETLRIINETKGLKDNGFDDSVIELYLSLAYSRSDLAKSVEYLDKIKVKFQENSKYELLLLFLEGAVYSNFAIGDDSSDRQHFVEKAHETYDELMGKITDDSSNNDRYFAFASQIDKGILAIIDGDIGIIEETVAFLNKEQKYHTKTLKENPLLRGEYFLLKGACALINENEKTGAEQIAKAKKAYRKVFGGHSAKIEFADQVFEHYK